MYISSCVATNVVKVNCGVSMLDQGETFGANTSYKLGVMLGKVE